MHASLYARLDRRGRNPIHGWICSGLFWPTALMAFRWYRPMIRDHHTLRGLAARKTAIYRGQRVASEILFWCPIERTFELHVHVSCPTG